MRDPRSDEVISGSMGSFMTLPVMSSIGLMPMDFDGVARSIVSTVGKASVHLFLCCIICFEMLSLIVRIECSTVPELCGL